MTLLVSIAVTIIVTLAIGISWGTLLERDRLVRFGTVADRLPIARLSRRQRRNLTATRADLRAALRRRT